MVNDAPAMMAWLILGGSLLVLAGLAFAGWWLIRRQRRDEVRAGVADELNDCVRRLGLGTVWQTRLFQADVYGIRGHIDGFDIRAELWEKSSRDFFRLSIHFPEILGPSFRLLTRERRGIEHLWRLQRFEFEDPEFDGTFNVYGRRDDQEVSLVNDLLDGDIRRRLVSLKQGVDGIQLGDHSLYIYVEQSVEPSKVESLIDDALNIAEIIYDGAVDEGLPEQAHTTQYEVASADMLGREVAEVGETSDFPEGTDDEKWTQPKPDGAHGGRLEAIGPHDEADRDGGGSSTSSQSTASADSSVEAVDDGSESDERSSDGASPVSSEPESSASDSDDEISGASRD